MVGGTAASFMIFFLPGMLLINAAIVKRSNEVTSSSSVFLDQLFERQGHTTELHFQCGMQTHPSRQDRRSSSLQEPCSVRHSSKSQFVCS